MATKNDDLKKLEQKTVDEVNAINAKWLVLDNLGPMIEGYEEPRVHHYKLYGSVGSIHFSPCNYSSIKNGKDPDADLLRALLDKFPPVPILRVKDSSTSFRPAQFVKDENEDHLYECFGVIVRIEPPCSYSQGIARAEWYSSINGNIWRFDFDSRLHQADLGRLELTWTSRAFGREPMVERCNFTPKHNAQLIKWATGDYGKSKTPNQFTLYWDTDSGKALDFAALMFKPSTPKGGK